MDKDFCLSCHKEPLGTDKTEHESISIDQTHYDVCLECWNKMTPFERVMLYKLFGGYDEVRGMDLPWLVDVARDLIYKGFSAMHGHDISDKCQECVR